MKGECVITNRTISNAKYLFLDSFHVMMYFVLAVVELYEQDRQCTYNVLTIRRVRMTIIEVLKHEVLNIECVFFFCLSYRP